jgi:cell division protein FtsZ
MLMSAAFRQAPEPFPLARLHDSTVMIRVVGIGGAGGNAVARMAQEGIAGIEFIVANTDAQALSVSPVAHRLRLGESLTRGLGAGGDPAIGARAAQESIEDLRAHLRGSDLVFVTAGMGGGTGTGAAPVVARLARDLGALVVAVVSRPFRFEGVRRARLAEEGIAELRPLVDTLIVVPNERLLAIVDPHKPFTAALKTGDDILRQGVQGISDLITIPGLINLDFADVRSIVAGAGTALMAIGEAVGDRRALEATQHAIESSLLERDIRGARRILLNVTGGSDLTLREINEAATTIQHLAHPEATIIFGTVQDPALDGAMRVTLIATAFAEGAPGQERIVVHEESVTPTRHLLPAQSDVLTPEALLGDAWPLPASAGDCDSPTMALPALPSLQPSGAKLDAAPDEDATKPRLQRTLETAWPPASPSSEDSSALDIPAFLRRK